MTEQEPRIAAREFWIVPNNDTVWIKSDYNPEHYTHQDYFKKENPIHTIEYSAYEALQKRCEEFERERNNFSSAKLSRDIYCAQIEKEMSREIRDLNGENASLKQRIAELEAELGKYRGDG